MHCNFYNLLTVMFFNKQMCYYWTLVISKKLFNKFMDCLDRFLGNLFELVFKL